MDSVLLRASKEILNILFLSLTPTRVIVLDTISVLPPSSLVCCALSVKGLLVGGARIYIEYISAPPPGPPLYPSKEFNSAPDGKSPVRASGSRAFQKPFKCKLKQYIWTERIFIALTIGTLECKCENDILIIY